MPMPIMIVSDLAPSVFSNIGAMVLGELDVHWYFM
jgi:hypothetical protein